MNFSYLKQSNSFKNKVIMVLIGCSGVEEPRPSYFWNAWSACTAERWKLDADLETQKIEKMTREQLIEYITDLTRKHKHFATNMRKQFADLADKNFQDGRRADIVFRATLKSIFELLPSRLNDVNLIDVECVYKCEDIKNIETVMAGNISASDYTALLCVHQSMTREAKQLEATKQRIENRKLSRHLSGFIHHLSGWIQL